LRSRDIFANDLVEVAGLVGAVAPKLDVAP